MGVKKLWNRSQLQPKKIWSHEKLTSLYFHNEIMSGHIATQFQQLISFYRIRFKSVLSILLKMFYFLDTNSFLTPRSGIWGENNSVNSVTEINVFIFSQWNNVVWPHTNPILQWGGTTHDNNSWPKVWKLMNITK